MGISISRSRGYEEPKNVKRRRREEQQLPFTAYEMLTGIMGKASAT